jgi:hypothetical protein
MPVAQTDKSVVAHQSDELERIRHQHFEALEQAGRRLSPPCICQEEEARRGRCCSAVCVCVCVCVWRRERRGEGMHACHHAVTRRIAIGHAAGVVCLSIVCMHVCAAGGCWLEGSRLGRRQGVHQSASAVEHACMCTEYRPR